MEFKAGDKVKVVSLSNTFNFTSEGLVSLLNKTLTVYAATPSYVVVEENTYWWSARDLTLVNNNLEIE